MIKSTQRSEWGAGDTSRTNIYDTKDNNDEDERRRDRYRRRKTAFGNLNCCCPCSTPLLLGLLVGALVMGVAFATFLSLYLVDTDKARKLAANAGPPTTVTTATTTTVTTATTTSSTSSTSSTSTTTTPITTSTTATTATTATTSMASTTTATTATTATTSTTTTTTTTKPYCTTRVSFDDIPSQSSTSGVIPNGYKNLRWQNALYLNASTTLLGGYKIAVNSPPYVGYNPGGLAVNISTANGTRFSFDSIVVASGWRDNLSWNIKMYRGGVNLINAVFPLTVMNQTTISCGSCTNLDVLYMTASGGTPVSGLPENGTEFAFDDLCISFGY